MSQDRWRRIVAGKVDSSGCPTKSRHNREGLGDVVMARIDLEHVTKTYPGRVPAVNDLSLDVQDGDFMVFVGPSGSGKSTALRMIAGLEDVTAGEIRIGDRVVNDLQP
jgi:ABC-type bacteriocin/lantibiotic exporter with double-glycine peptidase domain